MYILGPSDNCVTNLRAKIPLLWVGGVYRPLGLFTLGYTQFMVQIYLDLILQLAPALWTQEASLGPHLLDQILGPAIN